MQIVDRSVACLVLLCVCKCALSQDSNRAHSSIELAGERAGIDAWAGSYSLTNTSMFSVDLTLSGKAGAKTLFNDGCTGKNHTTLGKWLVAKNELTVQWNETPPRGRDRELKLVPVIWGSYRLLVPRYDIVVFCNDARSEHPTLTCEVYLRKGKDVFTKPKEPPALPVEYMRYRQMNHIEGRLTNTSSVMWDAKGRFQRVRLDVGFNDGVLPEMRFFLAERPNLELDYIDVKRVRETESEAVARLHSFGDQTFSLSPDLNITSNQNESLNRKDDEP